MTFKLNEYLDSLEDYTEVPIPETAVDKVAAMTSGDCTSEDAVPENTIQDVADNNIGVTPTAPVEADTTIINTPNDGVIVETPAATLVEQSTVPVTVVETDVVTEVPPIPEQPNVAVETVIPAGAEGEDPQGGETVTQQIADQAAKDSSIPLAHNGVVPQIAVAVDMDKPTDFMDIGNAQVVTTAVQDINQGLNTAYALESIKALVRQAGVNGISQSTAAFIHSALLPHRHVLGDNTLTSSLENYTTGGKSHLYPVKISTEDIKELSRKALAYIKKAIAKLREIISHVWNSLKNSVPRVSVKVDELILAIQNAKFENIPSELTVPVKNGGPVFANGKFIQPSANVGYGPIIKWMASVYAKDYATYLTNIGTVLKAWDPERNDASELVEKMDKLQDGPLKHYASTSNTLPGNKLVTTTATQVYLTDDETAAEPGTEVTLKNFDKSQAKKEAVALRNLVDDAANVITGGRNIVKAIKQLEDDVDLLSRKLESDKIDDVSKEQIEEVSRKVASIITDSAPKHDSIIREAMRYANTATGLYNSVINTKFQAE